jgi:hypothetical protein
MWLLATRIWCSKFWACCARDLEGDSTKSCLEMLLVAGAFAASLAAFQDDALANTRWRASPWLPFGTELLVSHGGASVGLTRAAGSGFSRTKARLPIGEAPERAWRYCRAHFLLSAIRFRGQSYLLADG